jgi:Cap4 SAVED domain
LMECVFGAPQIVAKMDLKTSPKMEVFGSDGIHAKWNASDNCLDLFFGEAKLERNCPGGATLSSVSICI